MSGEELKPCPFCGGDVSFHRDEECPGCHLIHCGQCCAFFDFATGADPSNDCESVDALRATTAPMWNARGQLAAIQDGMVEEVEVMAHVATMGFGQHYASGIGEPIDRCTPGELLMTVSQHQRILSTERDRLTAALNSICVELPFETYPHDHPLHRAVFMARDSYTGSETFEEGVHGLIAELKEARQGQGEAQMLREAIIALAEIAHEHRHELMQQRFPDNDEGDAFARHRDSRVGRIDRILRAALVASHGRGEA